MKKAFLYALLCVGIALTLFTLYVNVDALIGAFGDGPPYYGRTTNMDKWENPIPKLMVFDAVVMLILWIGCRQTIRQLK